MCAAVGRPFGRVYRRRLAGGQCSSRTAERTLRLPIAEYESRDEDENYIYILHLFSTVDTVLFGRAR